LFLYFTIKKTQKKKNRAFLRQKNNTIIGENVMIIKEIMTDPVITIESNEIILEACNKYKKHKVGCLVVTSGKNLIGILTERDIIERAIADQKNPQETKVEKIMSENIKTIYDTDSIEKAVEKMKKYKIKKLPVLTETEDLVGIITYKDISNISKIK